MIDLTSRRMQTHTVSALGSEPKEPHICSEPGCPVWYIAADEKFTHQPKTTSESPNCRQSMSAWSSMWPGSATLQLPAKLLERAWEHAAIAAAWAQDSGTLAVKQSTKDIVGAMLLDLNHDVTLIRCRRWFEVRYRKHVSIRSKQAAGSEALAHGMRKLFRTWDG